MIARSEPGSCRTLADVDVEPWEVKWTWASAMTCFFIGPGGVGIVGILVAHAMSESGTFVFGLQGSFGRLVTFGCGVFLIAAGLQFFYAAARGAPVIRVDENGIVTWNNFRTITPIGRTWP